MSFVQRMNLSKKLFDVVFDEIEVCMNIIRNNKNVVFLCLMKLFFLDYLSDQIVPVGLCGDIRMKTTSRFKLIFEIRKVYFIGAVTIK